MHDHRRGFLDLFPDWLHHLSRERWRKILRIHGVDRRYLLSDIGFARSACLCDAASGDYHTYSGFSPEMGPPQANCALDNPDLALRLGHRRARVFDALQMVSPRGVMQAILPARNRRVDLKIALPWDAADRIVCVR
jgi:hypothetical protein